MATALRRKGFAECSLRAIEHVKVLVGAANEPANRVYQKCSFTLADQISNHGVASNIYIAETNAVLKQLAPEELVRTAEPRPGKTEIVGIPSRSTTGVSIPAKRTDE